MHGLLSPTSAPERVLSLDILRGIAILGILSMNIQSFAMPGAAYINPTAYGDLEGVNLWVWTISHLFADQKFMTLFSILFGAGILLVADRMEQKSKSPLPFHFKRNFWLLIFGLIHAYLIWYGDILFTYAISSFLVVWVRNRPPRTLFLFGIIVLFIPQIITMSFSATIHFMPEEAISAFQLGWHPTPALIAEEIAAVTGSLGEQLAHNAQAALGMQTFVFLTLFLWRASGLMLIGMAFYKWGILSAARNTGFYWKGMLISFAIGFPLTAYGIVRNFGAAWSLEYSMFTGSTFNYWGSLGISFGYLSAVMLFSKSGIGKGVKQRIAAIGQMALSNYIAQSLIGVLIFYGIGLGLFGQVDRIYQAFITLGIWTVQYMWSKPWLDSFRFGPLEWAWRSLTYGSVQPMKKRLAATNP